MCHYFFERLFGAKISVTIFIILKDNEQERKSWVKSFVQKKKKKISMQLFMKVDNHLQEINFEKQLRKIAIKIRCLFLFY